MGSAVRLRMDWSTGIPMLILGTKQPSITSNVDVVGGGNGLDAGAKLAKSAERMDGAILTDMIRILLRKFSYFLL